MNNFIADPVSAKEECSRLKSITVDADTALDIFNIGSGAFDPLKGFMTSQDYHDVIENMHLESGKPWTLPITLDVKEEYLDLLKAEKVCLRSEEGGVLAILEVEDVYKTNSGRDIPKIFGTDDRKHPGVMKEYLKSSYRAGGTLKVFPQVGQDASAPNLLPEETRKIFSEKGWKTVTGFQTRNPIHRAHEYLQRVALEVTDGIFIHPLIGWKKSDDFSPRAVVESYKEMVKLFYGEQRVVLSFFKTQMRYAGPREAVFHALVRKNYGCTHFIVGRDHAGVGSYYGKYAAHKIFDNFTDLGIEILKLHGPYYCKKCLQIVTEKTCNHGVESILDISGTTIRSMLKRGEFPPEEFMRKDISRILMELMKKEEAFNGE